MSKVKQATKIVYKAEAINIITTQYSEKFEKYRNRRGRRKRNFDKMSQDERKKCLEQKIKGLYKVIKDITDISKLNEFNYFVTCSGCDRKKLNQYLDRLRKADPNKKNLILASWGKNRILHYHLMIYTDILSKDDLIIKGKDMDIEVKEIYNQQGLTGYFIKNVVNIISILKQDDENLLEIQKEIYKYSKILTSSRYLAKVETIKNPSEEQIAEVCKNNHYIEGIEYSKGSSNIKIDKFTR